MMPISARPRSNLLISILNWNGLADTIACIEGIAPKVGDDWDIVVIDNGSAEDPSEQLRAQFPALECVRLTENTGFTGGQNIGMQFAIDRGYEAVLLLNNDCEISAAAVAELLRHMRSDRAIAAVSPLIYCTENRSKPQMVGGWFDWEHHRSARPSDPDAVRPDGMAAVLPGTVLLLRCSALQQIGLLDNRYFAYYEDNDLSARLAAAGMAAVFCKTALAWHSSRPVHAYSDMALYLSARNAWLFWRTHTPPQYRRRLFRDLLAQSLYEIALLKKAGADKKCKAVTAGFWDAQWQRTGAPPRVLRAPALLNAVMCFAPYLSYDFLTDPWKAMKSRLKREHS